MKTKKEKRVYKHPGFKAGILSVLGTLVVGAVGLGIDRIFNGKYVLAGIIIGGALFFGLIAWITYLILNRDDSIVKILRENLNKRRYTEIVRIATALDRPLTIANRFDIKHEIGKVLQNALRELKREGKTTVETFEGNKPIDEVIYLTRIDFLGWSYFKTNQINNASIARNEVIKVIKCIIDDLDASRGDPEELYKILGKAFSHLLGFTTDNIAKQRDLLSKRYKRKKKKNDPNYTYAHNYLNEIIKYGRYVPYIYGKWIQNIEYKDPDHIQKAMDSAEESVFEYFSKLINDESKHPTEHLRRMREFCSKKFDEDPKYRYKTCNPLARYYEGRYYLAHSIDKSRTKDCCFYLEQAKTYAEIMMVGYCDSDRRLDVFAGTIFKDDFEALKQEYPEVPPEGEKSKRKPEPERMVKAMRLLGYVAKAYDEFEDAMEIMAETVKAAQEIDRNEIYESAQKNVISLRELLFRKTYKNKSYETEVVLDELDKMELDMNEVLMQTRERLHGVDSIMERSCKERSRRYKRWRKELVRKGEIKSWEK